MSGDHAHEYVGRHRKPDDEPEEVIGAALRKTLALFTHGTVPMHLKKEK